LLNNPQVYSKFVKIDYSSFIEQTLNFFYDYPEYEAAQNEIKNIKYNFYKFFNNYIKNYNPYSRNPEDKYIVQFFEFLKYCQGELLKFTLKISYNSFLNAKITHN